MRCPKCDHDQKNNLECEKCGLIFSRYQQAQEKKKLDNEARETANQQKSKSIIKYLLVFLLMVATSAATYYFVAGRGGGKSTANVAVQPPPAELNASARQRPQPLAAAKPDSPQAMQAAPVEKEQFPLERAKNATVFIKTPWGSGSGFFVAKNYIITNKHVVEFNPRQLADLRDKTEKIRQLVELEKQKIARWRARMAELPNGPERRQLAIVIDEHESELQKILPQLEERESRLAQLEQGTQASDIKIYLADGSEYQPNFMVTSDRHDLAILALFSCEVEKIPRLPAGEGYLQAGTKVYSIGSPFGLQQTMTSGVISAYRKNLQDEQVFLQTDAAINPGNSGGPLIDERGYALGVNTMILRDSEGLGFAIPIDVVFAEFSSTLN